MKFNKKTFHRKIKALGKKKYNYDFTWIDPLRGSKTLVRHVPGCVDVFVFDCFNYVKENMTKSDFIQHMKKNWYGLDNFMLLDLLKLLDKYKK